MPLFRYDKDLRRELGFRRPAGIDEAGRGPLAGPVVAAAVILAPHVTIDGLDDSKKLTAPRRRELFFCILAGSIACGVGMADPGEIDRINILQATKEAMGRALADLAIQPDMLLIDAVRLDAVPLPQKSIIRGDGTSASIAAASIIAKEIRDGIMRAEDVRFPGYGFARNKGYGTKEHLAALRRLGPTALHRRTFAPVRDLRLF